MQAINSEVLTGGFVLMLSGFIMNALRETPGKIFHFIVKHISTVIEIPDNESMFETLKRFMEDRKFVGGLRSLSVNSKATGVSLTPAPGGKNFFFYKGRLSYIYKYRKEVEHPDKSPFYENIQVRIFTRKINIIKDLLKEANDKYTTDKKDTISIITNSWWGSWNLPKKHPARKLDTVILPDGMRDHIVDSLKQFYDGADRYNELGIPHRAGYLFWGVPGSGKSTLIKALAHELDKPVAVLPISDNRINDTLLVDLFNNLPKNAFVLIEDIDCIFDKREASKDEMKITFAGLLNAMDGVASPEGIVYFVTTNHIEKIDGALMRPGRLDHKIEFKNADADQIYEVFKRFVNQEAAEIAKWRLEPYKYSMAQLQQFLLEHKDQSINNLYKLNSNLEVCDADGRNCS